MKYARIAVVIAATMVFSASAQNRYLGNLTVNPYLPPATIQPAGTFTNPYGNSSNSPQLFNSQGQFMGNVNTNKYDPNSIANPYGAYGNKYSPTSINNPYGAGNPYYPDSPTNPYGKGMSIYGK
jgi:hypothetical protein